MIKKILRILANTIATISAGVITGFGLVWVFDNFPRELIATYLVCGIAGWVCLIIYSTTGD
jgi:hypothetical protein